MMNNDFRFLLDSPRVTGRRQQKATCPKCGRKRCLVRYVDTQNQCQYVSDVVGRCDHEQSCGYHYKPSDYYRDNPWAKECVAIRSQQPAPPPPPLPPLQPLPMDYVHRCHTTRSTFWQWLSTDGARQAGINQDSLQRVYEQYHVGATRDGDVVFWQIDREGRVRSGHVMRYDTTGHRHGYQGWFHTQLQRCGMLALDWQLYQCLFGEHLLAERPDATVCLVESEKTALIMAALQPRHLWLATCGCNGLKPDRLECLRGRRVVLFPDSGCLDKWRTTMQHTDGIAYTLSEHLEQYPPNTDLADLVLQPP